MSHGRRRLPGWLDRNVGTGAGTVGGRDHTWADRRRTYGQLLVEQRNRQTQRNRHSNRRRLGIAIFPIMGYVEDVIDGKFGVSGGIAIVSDGAYCWRRDAAEFVERYGIGLPEE